MMHIIFLFLLTIFYAPITCSAEISLLDEDEQEEINTVNNEAQTNETLEAQESIDSSSNDTKFQQMSDFIEEEDEKLKELKLLNLDLQKSDLLLKKKEIDQKINQLGRNENLSVFKEGRVESEVQEIVPSVKLVSIFLSDSSKKAILNINGVNIAVSEGQQFDSFVTESIDAQKVLLEFEDGQSKELYIS